LRLPDRPRPRRPRASLQLLGRFVPVISDFGTNWSRPPRRKLLQHSRLGSKLGRYPRDQLVYPPLSTAEWRTALRSEDFASRLASGATILALQLTWQFRLSMGYWISGSG